MVFRNFFLALILICLAQMATAQPLITEISDSEKRVILADSILTLLQGGGVIIVRLESNAKKLKEYKKLFAKQQKPRKKEKIQKRIDAIVTETNQFNQELVTAFHDYYTFSDFLIMYDTDYLNFKNGEQSGFFLDKDLNLDPAINLNDRNYIFLRKGVNNHADTNRRMGLILTDSSLKDLRRPLPYFHPTYNSLLTFFKVFLPFVDNKVPLDAIVIKLNNKLKLFNTPTPSK